MDGVENSEPEYFEDDDPFHDSDDESKDELYMPNANEEASDDEVEEKKARKKGSKGKVSKGKGSRGKAMKASCKKLAAKEVKLKLAELVKSEEVIYNLNHKLHCNHCIAMSNTYVGAESATNTTFHQIRVHPPTLSAFLLPFFFQNNRSHNSNGCCSDH